jgi:F-type H+-transporting ATPase subunit delta
MRETTIARNYAEALLTLAQRAEDPHGWGRMFQEVAGAIEADPRLRRFLEAPRVPVVRKNAVLAAAFQDRFPTLLVRFLQTLVTKRRQMLIPVIASEYFSLLDQAEGRVHAQVTVARAQTDADRDLLTAQLSRALGKQVVPHVVVNPAILGGVVVRVGDTVMDGSVRRRLARLRQTLGTAAVRG